MAANMSQQTSGRSGRRRRMPPLNAEMNITPLVDVMLVLLIIFMVTSPMLVAGINIDLPETSASPAAGQDEPLAIDVDSNGSVYLNENKIELEHLVPKLRAITHEKMDTRIFVRGDKNVDYGKVIAVIGAVNSAGFNKVALVTGIKQERTKGSGKK
jgi:biopolymer transport protein TolR